MSKGRLEIIEYIIMQNKNKLSWGYIAGIVSGITYGMNPLFGVPVINKGLDVNSLLFYRYGVATLLIFTLNVALGVALILFAILFMILTEKKA